MTGDGFHSSLARDDAGPTVSDAASAAADSNALSAAGFVDVSLVNVRSVKSRSVARMSALPGYESIRCLAANQGRHVRLLDKPYEYWTKLSNAKFSKRVSCSDPSRPVGDACSASALTGLS